jgi:hypothetical protein
MQVLADRGLRPRKAISPSPAYGHLSRKYLQRCRYLSSRERSTPALA